MAKRPLVRIPRLARPKYSEEQKFSIMHDRIILRQSWPEIEDLFAQLFKLRSQDGLTSVYYRTRKEWGMNDVLKTGSDGFTDDRNRVSSKAESLSYDFLKRLGYRLGQTTVELLPTIPDLLISEIGSHESNLHFDSH